MTNAKIENRFYKNANVEARIGDVVKCGLTTSIVVSISEYEQPDAMIKNCSFGGKLHLNCVSEAELVNGGERWTL